MKFMHFKSQDERRKFGGSCFIEFQFCKKKSSTMEEQRIAINNVEYWENDSLYICDDDMNQFWDEYSNIFNCGVYANLESGAVDLYGINFYSIDLVDHVIEKIKTVKPDDYIILLDWLNKAKEYNGFFILGV